MLRRPIPSVLVWQSAAPESGNRLRRNLETGCAGILKPAAPKSGPADRGAGRNQEIERGHLRN
jgi:hypothetical protein